MTALTSRSVKVDKRGPYLVLGFSCYRPTSGSSRFKAGDRVSLMAAAGIASVGLDDDRWPKLASELEVWREVP